MNPLGSSPDEAQKSRGSRPALALRDRFSAPSGQQTGRPGYTPAFTLTELVVGIGIIGALIGILFPVVAMARRHALQTKCSSNLHQIGVGLEAYNQNYRRLPQTPTPEGLSEALRDIRAAVPGVLICPADESGRVSYGLNAAFAGLPKTAGEPGDMLATETAPRHAGRANVLFFDGHVSLHGE